MDSVLPVLACLIICILKCAAQDRSSAESVTDLTSESQFRSIQLKWNYRSRTDPLGFVIALCEMTPWTRADCFERYLLTGKKRSNVLSGHYDSLNSDSRGRYEAKVWGLRMHTNYTVCVEAMDGHNGVGEGVTKSPRIMVQTKGFSAHATNCLANSSDIVVHSGPYFGGKIAVEGSTDERCALYGNRSLQQETYTLKIDHQLCGSKTVNESRIETVVVVHESSSVVTHNSRRFLVQCNFIPDTFTIKAAFNIPREGSEAEKRNLNYRQLEEALKNSDSNEVYTYDHYRHDNHVKDSRMSSEQAHSVLQGAPPGYESQMLSLLVVIIVLVIVIVVVIGFSLWCYVHTHRRRSDDIETLSTSGSSFLAYDGEMRPWGHDHTLSRTVSPFVGHQVALVSLKPVKELY